MKHTSLHFSFRIGLLLFLLLLLIFGIYRLQTAGKSKSEIFPHAIADEGALSPGGVSAGSLNPFTGTDVSCDSVNELSEHSSKNPYLNAAWVEERESYNYLTAVDQFLEDQNILFSDYITDLSGTDIRCELSRSDVPDAMVDQRIEPLPRFAANRFKELRQIDCALYQMRETGKLICPYYEAEKMTRIEAFSCEEQTRIDIANARDNLRMATRIALIQLDEMAMAWPVHKRLECLNENLGELRKEMVELLTVFAKLPPAFINAAQSR